MFAFEGADGAKHVLPPPDVSKLRGRALRDAVMGGDAEQTRYMFALLEAAGAEPSALDALYDLPQTDMLDVITRWGQYGDGSGVGLGESASSST